MSPAKTAEPIAISFGGLSRVGPRNHVLDRSADLAKGRGNWGSSDSLKSIMSHCCGVCNAAFDYFSTTCFDLVSHKLSA